MGMDGAFDLLPLLLLAGPQAAPAPPPPVSLPLPEIRDQFFADMRCHPAFAAITPPADPRTMADTYLAEAAQWREARRKRKERQACPAG